MSAKRGIKVINIFLGLISANELLLPKVGKHPIAAVPTQALLIFK
jgi:hypothetical protein